MKVSSVESLLLYFKILPQYLFGVMRKPMKTIRLVGLRTEISIMKLPNWKQGNQVQCSH